MPEALVRIETLKSLEDACAYLNDTIPFADVLGYFKQSQNGELPRWKAFIAVAVPHKRLVKTTRKVAKEVFYTYGIVIRITYK